MAASYPGSLKSFTTKTDKVDLVMAAHVNDLQLEVTAIETELGTDPAGSLTDVKTRLAVCLAANGAINSGTSNPGSGTEGELFYRTDEDILYIWDGSAWDAISFTGAVASGILAGTYPDPTLNAHIRAGLYYAPDNACVLALAGYNFDPGTATTFKDSSLYGKDFTIVSTPPEGAGKVSKVCADFDGVADTLSIADGNYAEFGDCDDITIECWIKHDVAGSEHFIWQNGSAIGNLSISTANKFVVVLNVGTGAATITSGSAYASITDWYHIVMTYQSTDHTLRLFVNGVADGTDATKSGDVDAASGDIFYIGSNGGSSEWFNGKIDGFRILRRDMLVAEALARYNAFK